MCLENVLLVVDYHIMTTVRIYGSAVNYCECRRVSHFALQAAILDPWSHVIFQQGAADRGPHVLLVARDPLEVPLGGGAGMPKLRAGSEAAARLLESDAAEEWAAAFAWSVIYCCCTAVPFAFALCWLQNTMINYVPVL